MARTSRNNSRTSTCKLQAMYQRRERNPRKEMSTYQEHLYQLGAEAEEGAYLTAIQTSRPAIKMKWRWTLRKNFRGSYGNGNNRGNGNGNGNDNGNGGDDEGDDGKDYNQDETTGIEWWYWWKWRQACYKTSNGDTRSHMWPVDAAVHVVANEVMENIEPAVQAIVLEPIRQNINVQGLILVIVIGAFVISCIQMVAGLVIVSMGFSLAGLTAIALAFVWWPWKRRDSQSQYDKESNSE